MGRRFDQVGEGYFAYDDQEVYTLSGIKSRLTGKKPSPNVQ